MHYNETQWSEKTYGAFLDALKALADADYKAFHERLCKTSHAEILGVRTPESKRIAKEIGKGDSESFLRVCGDRYYEEILIKGFVLAMQKKPLAEKRTDIDAFVRQIDNWAVCDGFCAALKPKKSEYPYLYEMCCTYLQSAEEYTRRTAIVLMMDYLLSDEYIDRVFYNLQAVSCDCYYVHMAVAWCVSMCYVKYPDKTRAFLQSNVLDRETHNKAIQKCVESYRVTADDKASLRALKR